MTDGAFSVRSRTSLALAAVALSAGPLLAQGNGVPASRDDDAALVLGAAFPEFQGTSISALKLFRWDAATSGFIPVPYQIDERVNHVFNAGTSYEFSELMYDVIHDEDGHLDADDELAFLMRDAGAKAPVGAASPAGAGAVRYEIEVSDPRPGSTEPHRWAYLMDGVSLPRSLDTYITWDGSRTSPIGTSDFDLGFVDRWLLESYRVKVPCGSGTDLIDRVKGRAGISLDRAESEELWNVTASYLGSIAGPVRAIRYVRGAASGLNSIHHDIIYHGYWERHVNLRVHSVNNAWLYVDMLPRAGTSLLTSLHTTPVAVDGVPETLGGDVPSWAIVRGPDGGLATMYDIPPSPFVLEKDFFYIDDASFNDKPVTVDVYSDQDDSAYGDHGVAFDGIVGTETDTIPAHFRIYPLCSNEGDVAFGNELRSRYDVPLQAAAAPQWAVLGAVASLAITREGGDLVLRWPPVAGAISYRVYVADTPSLPAASWTLAGEPTAGEFRDTGEASLARDRFYTVTAVGAAGEGPR